MRNNRLQIEDRQHALHFEIDCTLHAEIKWRRIYNSWFRKELLHIICSQVHTGALKFFFLFLFFFEEKFALRSAPLQLASRFFDCQFSLLEPWKFPETGLWTMADTKLYEVLGVPKSASDQEIKKVSWNQVGVHVELELIVALAWLRALVPCGVI